MKATFEMTKDERGGIMMVYTTSGGRTSSTYFSGPPKSIDHVCIYYLRGHFGYIRNWKQVDFIKRKYKEGYKRLFGGEADVFV